MLGILSHGGLHPWLRPCGDETDDTAYQVRARASLLFVLAAKGQHRWQTTSALPFFVISMQCRDVATGVTYVGRTLRFGKYEHLSRMVTPAFCLRSYVCCNEKYCLNKSNFLPRCMECRRGLTMRIVCLSVRLSVKRVHCDKMEERYVYILIPYERSFILAFWKEEWLVGATPSTLNFGSNGPRWSEIADFEPWIARSASAVIPSETIQLTLIGSPLRALQ